MAVPVSMEDHVESCFSPPRSGTYSSSSCLILHFYVKKIEEEQIREIEKAAASTAADHGLEVMSDELQVTCRIPHHLFLFFFLHPGAGNGPSPSLHHKIRRRPLMLFVALFHWRCSLPAGELSAPPPPGVPWGPPGSSQGLPEEARGVRAEPAGGP